MSALQLRNRQRVRPVNLRFLRRLIRRLLRELQPNGAFEVGVHLVAAPEMVRLNEAYLHHAGCTDVITFNHEAGADPGRLHGEIFICVDEAVGQGRRYRTSWPAEIARYVIHGLLHLRGHDDLEAAARRRMKRTEDRLLRAMGRELPFRELVGRRGASRFALSRRRRASTLAP
jgi:probable rRNA maturation factor